MRTGTSLNENGIPVADYVCDTCGVDYSICPIPESNDAWNNCLAPECASYDPKRDCGWMFQDDPDVVPIREFGIRPTKEG